MIKAFLSIILLSGLVGLGSCTKPNPGYVDNSPFDIDFIVKDSSGHPLGGAVVNLFLTDSDYQNNKNIFKTGTTDSSGKLTFPGIFTRSYDFRITKGCWNNLVGGLYSTDNFISGINTEFVDIELNEVGIIKFINNSQDPYNVYIDGALIVRLIAGYQVSYYIKAGSHLCEVKQISGYTTTPKDEKTNHVVNGCGTTTVNFP